jgi:hypothetical protein
MKTEVTEIVVNLGECFPDNMGDDLEPCVDVVEVYCKSPVTGESYFCRTLSRKYFDELEDEAIAYAKLLSEISGANYIVKPSKEEENEN